MKKGNPTQIAVEQFIDNCPVIRNAPEETKQEIFSKILKLIAPYQQLKK